jgi:hypothetical protein
MHPVSSALGHALADRPEARAFLEDAREKVAADATKLPVLFPQLPRRVGRAPVTATPALNETERYVGTIGRGRFDLDAWRACDAAALELLHNANVTAHILLDLFHHGDLEEKAMVLRSLTALPGGEGSDAAGPLFGEAQRTNNVNHFATLALDSDFVVRALGTEAIQREDARRLVLKLAFLDLPLERLFGWQDLADGELTRMIQDLATEREAATRKVWHDTNHLIGHAPIAGTRARILGGLEHGDDAHRLAAVRGLAALPDAEELFHFARERADREPHPEVRAALRAIVPE